MIVLRPLPSDSLSHVPAESVGTFVYGGGEISLTDSEAPTLVRQGPVAVDLRGFLKADKDSAYEISADLKAHATIGMATPANCFMQTWLDSESIGQKSALVGNLGKQDAAASLAFYVDLKPGIHSARLWLACNALEDISTSVIFSIKTPRDRNFRPMNEKDVLRLDK